MVAVFRIFDDSRCVATQIQTYHQQSNEMKQIRQLSSIRDKYVKTTTEIKYT